MAFKRRKADADENKISKMRIAKNDTVMVIAGDYRYRGRTGKVLKVFPETRRIIVEKVRFVKRHTRAMLQQGQQGGILEKEAPIHVSNVMLVCPKCGKPTRLGTTKLADGTRERVCKKCNEMVPRVL
jgi:large subunit ribosomal protein L24